MAKRKKGTPTVELVAEEGKRLLSSIPKETWVLALHREGQPWDTPMFAAVLARQMHEGQDIAMLIGGPDGLSQDCLRRADQQWSLSPLTLPHGLVRIVVAEQVYRAYTLLKHHPYHR
jgi:23S rRNA (pseudouridine1915-N3)-methyltransferase